MAVVAPTRVELIPVDQIDDQPENNIRVQVGDVSELAESIKQRGLINPLTVAQVKDGYRVVAGFRRMAALRKLGVKAVPATVREEGTEAETIIDQLTENIQREDLSAMEEARAFRKLAELKVSQRDIAKMVSRSQPYVSKRVQLCDLPSEVQDAVDAGSINVHDAEDLAVLKDDPELLLRVFNNRSKGNIPYLIEQARATRAKTAERQNRPEPSEDELKAAKDAASKRRALTKAVKVADEDRGKAVRAAVRKRTAKTTILEYTLDQIIRLVPRDVFDLAWALVGTSDSTTPFGQDFESYLSENEEENRLRFAYAICLAKGHDLLLSGKEPLETGTYFAKSTLEHLSVVAGYEPSTSDRYLVGELDLGEVAPPEPAPKAPKAKAATGKAAKGSKVELSDAPVETGEAEAEPMAQNIMCPDCQGTGHPEDDSEATCGTCNGTGWVPNAEVSE